MPRDGKPAVEHGGVQVLGRLPANVHERESALGDIGLVDEHDRLPLTDCVPNLAEAIA